MSVVTVGKRYVCGDNGEKICLCDNRGKDMSVATIGKRYVCGDNRGKDMSVVTIGERYVYGDHPWFTGR